MNCLIYLPITPLCYRHNSFRRQMNLSNPDFNPAQFQRQESLSGLGRIKPELYKQRSIDAEDGHRTSNCGRLHFILKFDFDLEQLIVKIHKAQDLPAKDFSGTSDPYVKIYLLPDRKTKHQTKVHRKTLNPVFDEVFLFPVAYADLSNRKLHFSIYDFDRFSRHDLIGQVVVDNFLDLSDFPRETKLCRNIQYVTSVRTSFFTFFDCPFYSLFIILRPHLLHLLNVLLFIVSTMRLDGETDTICSSQNPLSFFQSVTNLLKQSKRARTPVKPCYNSRGKEISQRTCISFPLQVELICGFKRQRHKNILRHS